jgi:hypothetical protein
MRWLQVVIMLVIDKENDRALLSRQSRFVPRMWSCLAGFIEVEITTYHFVFTAAHNTLCLPYYAFNCITFVTIEVIIFLFKTNLSNLKGILIVLSASSNGYCSHQLQHLFF